MGAGITVPSAGCLSQSLLRAHCWAVSRFPATDGHGVTLDKDPTAPKAEKPAPVTSQWALGKGVRLWAWALCSSHRPA